MRLRFVFSLLVGVAALLTVTQRFPRDARVAEPAANANPVTPASDVLAVRVVAPRVELPPPAPAVHGRLYRWRDERGAVHFQTDPPPAGVRVDVIPFVRQQPRAAPAPQASAVDTVADIAESLPAALSVYTPEGFDDLMRRVEETAFKLRDRNQYIEALKKQL